MPVEIGLGKLDQKAAGYIAYVRLAQRKNWDNSLLRDDRGCRVSGTAGSVRKRVEGANFVAVEIQNKR